MAEKQFKTSCQQDMQDATLFVFSSCPRPLIWDRPNYRNDIRQPRGVHDYYNMMWDRHIYRGDTQRAFALKEAERKRQLEKRQPPKKKKKRRQQGLLARRIIIQDNDDDDLEQRPITPDPVDGRSHFCSQTDQYVEELESEAAVINMTTQTVSLHELPVDLTFKSIKLGDDAETQILAGDLFDFDNEVKPIIDTVVCRVIEQALLEVMEEQELACLREQQSRFEDLHREQLKRLHQLEDREQKIAAEKQLIANKERAQLAEEGETENRLGAGLFSSSYLNGLSYKIFEALRRDHFLDDPMIREIEETIVPWLNNSVEKELLSRQICNDILSGIIEKTSKRRLKLFESKYQEADLTKGIDGLTSDESDENSSVSELN